MATVTINEATQLVRRSRRGVYRDMEDGRLSYKVGRDGRRRIDTSELERVYGPLIPPAVTPARATDTPEAERLLAELVDLSRRQGEELAKLREEVAQLRRLPSPEAFSKPDHGMPAPTPADDKPVSLFAAEMAALRARQEDR